MLRRTRLAFALALALVAAGRQADAQYFYPYGMGYAGYGWGGWGGGNLYSDIARGMGVYAAGAGVYNYQTAQANSINANTLMRWNQYVFESQQETNRRYARLQAERANRRTEALDAIQKRLRENPSQNDVFRGDALNVLLDDLSNPRTVSASVLRQADSRINGRVIRSIPFFFASDAITLCLDQLSDDASYPAALRVPELKAERDAFGKAIDEALAQDAEGDVRAETLAKVREAVAALHDKAQTVVPENPRSDKINAMNYIKGLAGVARMMERPKFEKVLEDLEPTRQASVGDLLGFMQNYHLRFGPARNGDQRSAYTELFALLSDTRKKLLGDAKETPIEGDVKSAPSELFRNLDTKHLIPAPPAPGAKPAAPK